MAPPGAAHVFPDSGGLTNQGKNKKRVEEAWDSHALDRRSQDFLLLPYSSQSLLKHENPILSVLH